MSVHLQKVLRHAEKKLAKAAERTPTEALDVYRAFLKLEEHRLFLAHRAGEGGLNFVHKRAATLDVVLRHIWQTALQSAQRTNPKNFKPDSISLVATGGFGRGELCPYSDVDLLFLCASKLTAPPKNIIEQILYVLWDVGFKVGHATRTLEEAAQESNKDLRTKTSLLDARFIAGPEKLYQDFQQRFQRACLDKKDAEYLEWRLRDQTERHRKYGGTACVQEPHLKNGCGGLRDYQNLLWVARVRAGVCTTAALVEKGWLAQADCKRLDRAYDFLLRIRNELHYRQKRGDDLLTLKMQGQIAAAFHYPQKHTLRRIEAFMRDYYEAARDIFQIANLLSRRLCGQPESKGERIWSFLQTKKRDDLKLDGLVLKNNELHCESRSAFSDPLRILRAFQIMQRHNAALSAELETLIRSKLHLVNSRLLWLPKAREMLMDILKKKGKVGRIFRAMHETGVLGRLIPEFAPLTCLVQHEFFHVYTADEHTLVCLEQLDKVVDCPDDPFPKYRELFLKCEQPETLYIALVLHDVGKARHVQHHHEVSAQLAMRFARRMKLKSHALQTLLFLVYHHSTLTEFAQRRNLDDASAIREFARIVKDEEKLDMLMLLTFADAQGVSGKTNWSSWKELLVWNLYYRTKEMLEGEEEFFKKAELNRNETILQVRSILGKSLDQEEIKAHFDLLPRSYLSCSSEELIVRHIEQVHEFFLKHIQDENALKPFVRWLDKPNEGHSEVVVVTRDRERLFCKIAGSFALTGLNILSADVFTRGDNLVIDTFRVCTDRYEAVSSAVDRKNFQKTLTQSLQDENFNLRAELYQKQEKVIALVEDAEFPTRLTLDNETSREHTLLHIQTPDRIGLLYDIASCFADLNIVIAHSRIMTEKGAALDTFYLTLPKIGKIVDPALQGKLLQALRKAIALQK